VDRSVAETLCHGNKYTQESIDTWPETEIPRQDAVTYARDDEARYKEGLLVALVKHLDDVRHNFMAGYYRRRSSRHGGRPRLT
jgi:hypothetical protein